MAGNRRSHIVDSMFFGDGYSTQEVQEIFCDLTRMQRWLDVEVTLAECQGELGIIPQEAAQQLAEKGKLEFMDLDKIQGDIVKTKHSLLPLLWAWQELVDKESGQYVHYGATTQDILDTAQVLEVRDVIHIVERDLNDIIQILTRLAQKYENLVMVGRTHGQHALPTTLGLKIAVWADECARNYERLQVCKKNVLVSQLFGGVGTMSALSNQGLLLVQRFSERLGLGSSLVSWHTARDRFVEFISVLALITGVFGKIANEIIQLNKNGISELSEPFQTGQIGSSTMPHKRNPETCERIVTLAGLVKSCAGLSFDSLCSEHERDYRFLRLEWVTITDASLYSCCALSLMKSVLSDLVVNEENIQKNVENSVEYISSEAVMFFLAEKLGKQNAHTILYEASMRAFDKGIPLIDELAQAPMIAKHFTQQQLEAMMQPANYIGLAVPLIDNVVKNSRNVIGLANNVTNEPALVLSYIDPAERFPQNGAELPA